MRLQVEKILSQFIDDQRTRNLQLYDKQRYSVHIAILVKRGKIIAQAVNKNGSRSSGSGYTDRGIHAERNVIKELGDISQLRGAYMYVMRLARDREQKLSGFEQFTSSRPCPTCELFLLKCMREYGLRGVYYTE